MDVAHDVTRCHYTLMSLSPDDDISSLQSPSVSARSRHTLLGSAELDSSDATTISLASPAEAEY